MRVGHGYDVHRFEQDRVLVLRDVTIPDEPGLAAHSDGDVVIHALCDAVLGAAGLGDIGRHFPDDSEDWEGIDSRILLRKVVERLGQLALTISNVDLTVVAQVPRLAPYVDAMRATLAGDLRLEESRVNIKATTTEKMGFFGRAQGIATHAVALLEEG